MSWQPIDTAPVGVDVLVLFPAGRRARMSVQRLPAAGWLWIREGHLADNACTHWMPLPEPITED